VSRVDVTWDRESGILTVQVTTGIGADVVTPLKLHMTARFEEKT
jgi:hypothetical protein